MHRSAAAAFARRIALLLAPVADLVYPPVCFTCDARLEIPGALVCPSCRALITPVAPDHPAWSALRAQFRAPAPVDDFLTCFLFEKEGKLQELVHLLKYRGFRRVGGYLGALLGERVLAAPAYRAADLIVPVPLHRARERERGYNQSALIAAAVAAATGIAHRPKALVRTRFTRSQTELSLSFRRRNVEGAFAATDRGQLAGRSVMLVDDVVTSGSTIIAAAAALRFAGAERVLAASVAVAE